MNVVLVMFKDGERRDFPVSDKQTILGRRQDCQLRIPTKDVSRQHCALLLTEDRKIVAKDLGSSNGTFVNGKRIAERELSAGDRLRLGPVTFIVQIDGKPAQIKPDDAAPSTAEPSLAGDEEETFDLSEADFDLDAALGEPDDEQDMP
jgi:pSer/pThr/pTyr-binding forkhead associated (FHA) protein